MSKKVANTQSSGNGVTNSSCQLSDGSVLWLNIVMSNRTKMVDDKVNTKRNEELLVTVSKPSKGKHSGQKHLIQDTETVKNYSDDSADEIVMFLRDNGLLPQTNKIVGKIRDMIVSGLDDDTEEFNKRNSWCDLVKSIAHQ